MLPGLWARAAAGWAAACLVSAALAQANPPAQTSTPENIAAGKRLYTSYCARCHGLNMMTTSTAVFDLRTFPKEQKARFVESVTKGKGAMPAWGGSLKEAELDLLWAYVSAPR
jgi:mono/diheme cytochrome c family protein